MMDIITKNIIYHAPRLISDKKFIEGKFLLKMGKPLNLEKPRTFNEKIQWLKLYDRSPRYTTLADKLRVKSVVRNLLGPDFVVPTIAVWDSVWDIDFDTLPDKFVLKCNHDSGGEVVCADKKTLDIWAAQEKLNNHLSRDFFYGTREAPYKDIDRKVFCEEYLECDGPLLDYKYFCFGGKPEFIYISNGLEEHDHSRMSFVDLDGNRMPFIRKDYKPMEGELPIPANLKEMNEVAEILARFVGNAFVRVDLYNIGGHIYFSEFTFYPNSGMIPFHPEEWDEKLGDMIHL